jgi:hypothetical protein
MPIEPAEDRGLPRRDFLKVGLGFSLALTVGTAVVGCSDAAKTLSTGYVFLRPGDVELFSALTPAVVTELGAFDAAKRSKLVERTLQNIDGTCAALDLGSRQELRKLLDLLAIGPLRYSLTGVGAWNEAGRRRQRAGQAHLFELLRVARELALHRLPGAAGIRVQRDQLLKACHGPT